MRYRDVYKRQIFYRELISNGCDAITKLKKLELMGEYEKPEDVEYKIQVSVKMCIRDREMAVCESDYGPQLSLCAGGAGVPGYHDRARRTVAGFQQQYDFRGDGLCPWLCYIGSGSLSHGLVPACLLYTSRCV